LEGVILAKGPPEDNPLPARHFGQFTHPLGNVRFFDLGRFL